MYQIIVTLSIIVQYGDRNGAKFTLSQNCVRLFQNPVWTLKEQLVGCQMDMTIPSPNLNLSSKVPLMTVGGPFDVVYRTPASLNQPLVVDLENQVYTILEVLQQSQEFSSFFSMSNVVLQNAMFFYNASLNVTTPRRYAMISYFNNSTLKNITVTGNFYHLTNVAKATDFIFSALLGVVENGTKSSASNVTVYRISQLYLVSPAARIIADCAAKTPLSQPFSFDLRTFNSTNYQTSELAQFTTMEELEFNYHFMNSAGCKYIRDPIVGIWNKIALTIINNSDSFWCTDKNVSFTTALANEMRALYPKIMQDIKYFEYNYNGKKIAPCPFTTNFSIDYFRNEQVKVCTKLDNMSQTLLTYPQQCRDAFDILAKNDVYDCFGAVCQRSDPVFCVGCHCTFCRSGQVIIKVGSDIVCSNPVSNTVACNASDYQLETSCVNSCPTGYFAQNHKCQTKCDPGFHFNTFRVCELCPNTTSIAGVGQKNCVTACSGREILFNKTCYLECPLNTIRLVAVDGVVSCKACSLQEISFISVSGKLEKCLPKNVSHNTNQRCGKYLYLNDSFCIEKCPHYLYTIELDTFTINALNLDVLQFAASQYICLKSCSNQLLLANNSCLKPSEFENSSNYLRNSDSPLYAAHSCLNQQVNNSNFCDNACSSVAKYNITRQCTKCQDIEYVLDCTQTGEINQTIPGYEINDTTNLPNLCNDDKFCDGISPETECPIRCIFCSKGLCFQNCPFGYVYNNTSLKCERCKTNEFFHRTLMTCVSSCQFKNYTNIDIQNVTNFMGSGPYFSVNESILIYVNNLAICENGVSDAFCRNVTNQLCDFCEKSKIPSKPFLNDTTCVERCDTNTLYGFIVGQNGKITGHCKACDMQQQRDMTQWEMDRFGFTSITSIKICIDGCPDGQVYNPFEKKCYPKTGITCTLQIKVDKYFVCVSSCNDESLQYDVITKECISNNICVTFVYINITKVCASICTELGTALNLTSLTCVACPAQQNNLCSNTCNYKSEDGYCLTKCDNPKFGKPGPNGIQLCVSSCSPDFVALGSKMCKCENSGFLLNGKCVPKCTNYIQVIKDSLSYQVCLDGISDELNSQQCP